MTNHSIERLREFVNRSIESAGSCRILEAGCGSCSWLGLDRKAHIVGIDISEKQLARNPLIDEAILGDLMTYRFDTGSFDAVVNINVLEHLDRPEAAMENMGDALAPGGLLILKVPNAMSWKGLFTKFTPLWAHVWIYRTFLGHKKAGTEDIGPFKTYMRMSMRPHALRNWGQGRGLAVVYEDFYESPQQTDLRSRLGPLNLLVALFDRISRILSLGRVSIDHTEYAVVLQKPDDS